jgi:hypothetical protein
MVHDIGKVKHLIMGFEMGQGEVREGSVEVLGDTLDDLHVDGKPARLKG